MEEAAALAGLSDPLPVLDEAVDAQLLDVSALSGPVVVTFRHPLTQAAVYHDMAPAARVALHDRAAGVVVDERVRLRHRVLAAVTTDDRLAEDLTRAADRERRSGQWMAAADHLVTAARFSSTPEARRARQVAAVECLLAGRDLPRAVALLNDIEVDDTPSRLVAGEAAFLRGSHDEARRLLEAAWEDCDATATPHLAGRIAARLTDVFAFGLQPDEAAEWARRAYELAPDALTAPAVATAMVYSGNRAEGQRMILDEARVGRTPAERQVGEGALRAWLGDLAVARDVGLRADAALRDQGSLLARWTSLYMLECVEYRLGLWDDLLVRAEVVGSTIIDAGASQMAAQHLAFAALVRAERGDQPGASALLERADVFAGDYAMQAGWLAAARARAALAAGDPGAAVVAVESLLPRLAGRRPTLVVDWVSPYVEALVAIGRLDDAEAHLGAHEAWLERIDPAPLRSDGCRVRGLLAAARRDHGAAVMAFEAAVAHAERTGAPFDRGQAELAWGAFLRRRGQRRAAAARLESARLRFEALGARPFAARCEWELAACGLTPGPRRERRWSDLTPAELGIARLVSAGRTNREVAAELVISPKTVEFHLAAVFRKLNITSRSQLREHLPDVNSALP